MSKYTVYYKKGISGDVEQVLADEKISLVDFQLDYARIRALSAECLEEVYSEMQGENWSPNGEARPLIELKKVDHTSMSIGDIVKNDMDQYFMVDYFGFKPIDVVDTLN